MGALLILGIVMLVVIGSAALLSVGRCSFWNRIPYWVLWVAAALILALFVWILIVQTPF